MATGRKSETTEWEDLQVKLGNWQKRDIPRPPTEKEYDQQAAEQREAREQEKLSKYESATLDELDEFEDEEDERVLEEYRKKRIAEMQKMALRNRFGDLKTIGSYEWKEEVTDAPEDVFVVVLLTKPGLPGCELMENILATLARKFRATKFVKIRSEDAIRNYPDKNLPTVLVYNKSDVRAQFVTLKQFHGEGTTADGDIPLGSPFDPSDVEWALAKVGAVESDMEEDPRKSKLTIHKGRREWD